jgi:hypothetical protein
MQTNKRKLVYLDMERLLSNNITVGILLLKKRYSENNEKGEDKNFYTGKTQKTGGENALVNE